MIVGAVLADVANIEALVPERAWIAPFLVKREGWTRETPTGNGATFRSKTRGLFVMVSGAVELDGRRWIHVSVSRRDRLPSYDDLALVKRAFIGDERKALQVFAPSSEHYNLHAFCLHLWCCLDGDGLPDFRAMGQV